MEKETVHLIETLKEAAKSKGFSNYRLALSVGVPNSTIDRLFQLKNVPNLDLIIKIVKVLEAELELKT